MQAINFDKAVLKFATVPLLDARENPSSQLLKIASSGPDSEQLKKLDIQPEELKGLNFRKKPDCAYLHVVTAGAGEIYGANLKADYFHEKPRVVRFPEPGPNCQSTMDLGPGLEQKHHTFMKADGIYRHHDYSTPPLGSFVWERYNKPMHRGEVIVELPLSSWKNDLERFEQGTPLMWSQGSLVPFDVCSRCGFKFNARTPSRCDHMKYHKLEIPDDGIQVCVYNPDMDFYELSEVGLRPADKIAYCLRKVAGEGLNVEQGSEVIDSLNFPRSQIVAVVSLPEKTSKRKVVDKMASMENRLDVLPSQSDCDAVRGMSVKPEERDLAKHNLANLEWPEILHGAKKSQCMLAPSVFYDIVSSSEPENAPGVEDFAEALKTVFRDLKSEGSCESVENDTGYASLDSRPVFSSDPLFKPLQKFLSLDPSRAALRSSSEPDKVVLTIRKKGSEPSVSARILAREYAKYQTQFLSEKAEESQMYLAACGNRAPV